MYIYISGLEELTNANRSVSSVNDRLFPVNPGRFGPIPVRPGRFGPGRFGPISEVSRFGPVGAGRFGPIS